MLLAFFGLKEIEQKNTEMETWVHRLGEASSQISAGDFSTSLPKPPAEKIFGELTHNLEQMQARLNQYFSNLVLKDRLSSLGVMASGIAHELNTPLTTMQFILDSDSQLSADTRTRLQEEITRMGKITRDLLSFARPHPQEFFNLNEVVQKTEPLLKTPLTKNMALEVHLTPEEIPIRGVFNELQQILFNLVHNAMDATEGVSSPRILIQTEKREDGVAILSVTDNGSGIEKAALQKILDPFFTTKSPGRGTGLGLFVVHQIVQKHDAILSIESEKGVGTAVRILFLTHPQERKEAA
jgi:two-component system NtrC family sensor kinase